MYNQVIQKLIAMACDDSGEISFSNAYSGRGMHGKNCVGISGHRATCMMVIGQVIKDAYTRSTSEDDIDPEDTIDLLLAYETDSMGHGVIMYWPELEPIEDFDPKNIQSMLEDYAPPGG